MNEMSVRHQDGSEEWALGCLGSEADVGSQQLGVLGVEAHLKPTERVRSPWKEVWKCVDTAKCL